MLCRNLVSFSLRKEPTFYDTTTGFTAGENSRFSSLFATGDISHQGTSVTQQQKFHTDDVINVNIINLVVMGFQMQICSILRFSWLILVKCCVYLLTSSSKTQRLLLEKTIFHKYWLFC